MAYEISGPPPSKVLYSAEEEPHEGDIVIPGALVNSAGGFMRGHGTFYENDTDLIASVAGAVKQTNKLIRVTAAKQRYAGEIGDVVIGRIVDVQQKRWKVDTNGRLDSVLLLASVNLPGGELRRKSIEDELMMREYLKEGDLVSAEVQQCFGDGALSLQTRTMKYGKLGQGVLVKVPPHLVVRRKTHSYNLTFGAAIIFGVNGYIWISPIATEEQHQTGGYVQDMEMVPVETRAVITRLANCVRALARNSVPLYDTTVIHAFNASKEFEVKDLIRTEVADDIAEQVKQKMSLEDMSMDY